MNFLWKTDLLKLHILFSKIPFTKVNLISSSFISFFFCRRDYRQMRWSRRWTHSLCGVKASTSTLKMNCKTLHLFPSLSMKSFYIILTIYWMTFKSEHFYFCTVWSARLIILSFLCCQLCFFVFFSCFSTHQYLSLLWVFSSFFCLFFQWQLLIKKKSNSLCFVVIRLLIPVISLNCEEAKEMNGGGV